MVVYEIPKSFLDVCIALTSGIAALFIPLFYNVVIRLDEKYESRLIVRFFWSEKVVKRFLISTVTLIVSTILYSLKIEPWGGCNNFIISNSAAIITGLILIFNMVFGISSLLEMNKYQDPEKLFRLIGASKKFKEKEKRIVRFDLLFHSLKDLNYNKDFTKTICDELENEILAYREHSQNLPIEYYDALEQLSAVVFDSNFNNDYRQNRFLVFRLWGDVFFFKFPLDELTYTILWNHLSQAIEYDRDKLLIKHWERANSLIKVRGFKSRGVEFYDLPREERNSVIDDHDEFIRFHIVYGALLLHSNKIDVLKNCLEYTSSWPPEYYLLPKGSQKIIEIFHYFNDPFDSNNLWFSWKYSFPGSTGFEQDGRIKKSINQYLILLLFQSSNEGKEFFNYTSLKKNQCNSYQKTLDTLYYEIFNISDTNHFNQIYHGVFNEIQKENLLNKIEVLKSDIFSHRTKSISLENMDPSKIDSFCSLIEEELKPLINELLKVEENLTNISKVTYTGFVSTVDKDFFLSESEVDYIDYEKTFASVFTQNLKHRLGYALEQNVIQRFTVKAESIENAINQLKDSILIINFGVSSLSSIYSKSIINLGLVTSVSPRIYLIDKSNENSFGIKFNNIIMDENYEIKHELINNKIVIGIGKLSNGNLKDRFLNISSNDKELDNTIGVEISTSISIQIPEALKCVCLIEHQPYRESKDPDVLTINQIKDIFGLNI